MRRSKISEEQVAYALRQAEAGTAIGDGARRVVRDCIDGRFTSRS